MMARTAVLEVYGATKFFDGVRAVEDANLVVHAGEIHALVGENGAGKSTLIKLISGVLASDHGNITIDGVNLEVPSVHEAQRLGVATLHQELTLVPEFDAAENIFLGRRPPTNAFGLIRWRALRAEAASALQELGVSLPLGVPVAELSPALQTMVAIARALSREAKLLILDEPTASLTQREIDHLFEVLRQLRERGVSVLYVSHRLEEVFELCDRVTVMRDGTVVSTEHVASISIEQLIRLMVGRSPDQLFPERATSPGPLMLEATGLTGERVREVSFEVHRGEVLAIAGLAGSGRSELLRLVAGAQRRRTGTVALEGTPLSLKTPRAALAAGIALVPEERRTLGLVMTQSVSENLTATVLEQLALGRFIRRPARERRHAADSVRALQIKVHDIRQNVGELSGGNQQKTVLAKFLARRPRVLLLDEPTRGIDVGTKLEIYRIIRQLTEGGTAVVVVSSELPEVIGLADRIIVLREGELAGELAAATTDEHEILAHCYGRAA